jgi:hypothetical protein
VDEADATGQRLSLLRIPYGLDRLPRSIALDDPRLRCAVVGDEPLRLNSEPVPPDAMPLATGDHASRVAAAKEWLESLCGDYAPLRRQFTDAYLRFVAAQIEAHREELAARLEPYDGLYLPDDFLWSAPRPLPRGWVPVASQLLPADMVFWDGTQPIAIELAARNTDRQRALLTAGVTVYRIEHSMFAGLDAILPTSFSRFWEGQTLPSSPFRRSIPLGVLAQPQASE